MKNFLSICMIALAATLSGCEKKEICQEAKDYIKKSRIEAITFGISPSEFDFVEEGINPESDCMSQKATAMIDCNAILLRHLEARQ